MTAGAHIRVGAMSAKEVAEYPAGQCENQPDSEADGIDKKVHKSSLNGSVRE